MLPHRRPKLHLLFPLLALPQLVSANLSLQQLQAIADFPSSCQAAYQSPIPSCPDASAFTSGKTDSTTSLCTKDCFIALSKAATSIQKACQNTAAPPGTVIAHAFAGDLAVFLCSIGTGGGSPPASSSTASKVSSSSSATSVSSATESSSAEATSKKTSKTDSSSTSNTATSTVSSNTVVTSTVAPTSTTTTVSNVSPSSSQASSSSSSSRRPTQSLNPGGGGTPFDQVVPAGAPSVQVNQNMISLVFGLALAVVLGT